jgi:hypothetical protein
MRAARTCADVMREAEMSACPAAGRGGAVARRAGRRRATHDGFPSGRAQAATELMCNALIGGRRGERATEGTALMQIDHGLREGGGGSVAWQVGRRSGKMKATVIARRFRKEQLRGCADRVSAAHAHGQ